MVHSRCLTFAEAVLLLHMSKHGLLERLETIATYIVSVYGLMWFQIRVKHSWIEGPRHILTHLSLLKLQSPDVQAVLLPYLRTSAWYAHSESVLTTLLTSQDPKERDFAVEKILKIRGKQDVGKTKPRKRKLPELNEEATEQQDLIKWDRAQEPLPTCTLTRQEIKEFYNKPMEVPYQCGHTQPIERAVKEVTAASSSVYGEERRDGRIRSRAANREIMPVCGTKRDLLGRLD